MSEISATEASKRFADLLDAVEHRGETFTVVRRGRVVATIAPARRGTGADLRRILTEHPPDDRWADESARPASLRRRRRGRRSVERLILDTGVLVAIERGRASTRCAARRCRHRDRRDHGVRTARRRRTGRRPAPTGSKSHRQRDPRDLRRHRLRPRHRPTPRRLLAHARRSGRPRGAHDLQIAATARATGRVLITTDGHAFDDLPAVGIASRLAVSQIGRGRPLTTARTFVLASRLEGAGMGSLGERW